MNITNKYRRQLLLLLFLIVSAGISGYIGFVKQPLATPPPPAMPIDAETTTPVTVSTYKKNPVPISKDDTESPMSYATSFNIEPTEAAETIFATLATPEQSFTSEIPRTSTAYDLMSIAAREDKLTFHSINYGSLGYMVDEINGIKNSTVIKKYWIYYINGKKARIGLSNYFIHEGDVIMWKYEDEE